MRGFIQVPILILLLVGTGASVYLVQQKTHFFSQAFSNISSKEIINLFSNQQIATKSATQPFDYQLPTPTSASSNSGNSLISAFQRLLQRKTNQPSNSPLPAQINILPTPATRIPTSTTTPSTVPTPTPTPPVNSTSNSNPKPICGIFVAPSSTGYAPYQASVCVGNNSNPYQNIQQEWVDYDGNGSWDYQGGSWGCHSFTFQNPGTYFPKAKIVGVTGQESDICQTTAIVSAVNPTPTPTPTPTPSPSANSCSQGSLGMYIKFQDITANGPTLKYVNLSLKQPGTNNELWRFDGAAASNNVSAYFNYTQGDMYRIGLGMSTCGTYDIYVSSSGYQEKKFPNIVIDNDPWNDPEVYIFYGPLMKL